jgi:hypothetical protein
MRGLLPTQNQFDLLPTFVLYLELIACAGVVDQNTWAPDNNLTNCSQFNLDTFQHMKLFLVDISTIIQQPSRSMMMKPANGFHYLFIRCQYMEYW